MAKYHELVGKLLMAKHQNDVQGEARIIVELNRLYHELEQTAYPVILTCPNGCKPTEVVCYSCGQVLQQP